MAPGLQAITSDEGRHETEILSRKKNVSSLMTLPGRFIDKAREHNSPRELILDMDSSVSETYGNNKARLTTAIFSATVITRF